MFIVSLIAFASVIACGGVAAEEPTETTVAAEWPKWDSVDALANDADLVVQGVVGAFVGNWNIQESDGTITKTDIVHSVLVEEVLRGDAGLVGQEISVGYWDADVENVTPLTENDRVILFLDRFDWGGTHDGWVPLGSDSGVFELNSGNVVARGIVGPLAGLDLPIGEFREAVTK
jgi:hypothetical protein